MFSGLYVSLKLPKGIKLDDYGPEDISDIVNTLEQKEEDCKGKINNKTAQGYSPAAKIPSPYA